jgi:cytochrome P450
MATANTDLGVPEHIPGSLVYDFHIFGDARLIADPYKRAEELLREAPPVFWSPRGKCWYVAGHEALVDAFKEPEVFSNVLFPQVPDDYVYSPYPLQTDPPKHQKYAAPLKAVFSPRSVAKLEGRMRELARELIDDIADKGACDFIPMIAEPYPILIFLGILGVQPERFHEFRQVAVEYLNEQDQKVRFARMQQADALMSEYIEERRKRPQDDLISHLWTLDIDGEPITLVDMRRYAMMLFTAGLDSVTNGLGHAMNYFARHPELQSALRANRVDLNAACEELLRLHGVTTPPRRVARNVEFYGAPMREGDFVEMYVIAGNRSDTAFAQPSEFHMQRDTTHLTFGYGVHRCIGAHLARVEIQAFFDEWLNRMPEVTVGGKGATYDPGHVLRMATLPLVWDKTKVSASA